MYLLIDTSERDLINLALFNRTQIVFKNFSGRNRELLNCIDKVVKSLPPLRPSATSPRAGEDISALKGIMVVVGAGGFTSTRIATVVANAFGLALQIPLLAIKKTEVENVQKLIPKLLKQKSGHYISASYSGEPNITKAKDK